MHSKVAVNISVYEIDFCVRTHTYSYKIYLFQFFFLHTYIYYLLWPPSIHFGFSISTAIVHKTKAIRIRNETKQNEEKRPEKSTEWNDSYFSWCVALCVHLLLLFCFVFFFFDISLKTDLHFKIHYKFEFNSFWKLSRLYLCYCCCWLNWGKVFLVLL